MALSTTSSTSVHTPSPTGPTTTSSSTTSAFTTLTSSSTFTSDIPSITGAIDPGNNKYSYYGCYNETTGLNQTSGRRALYDGSMETLDTMTVATCLGFCIMDGYAFAGLEFEDECWCARYLNVYSAKLSDSQCNLPCKGNASELCGGALKLSVYQLNSNPTLSPAPRSTNVPIKLFIVGLAIAGLVLEVL